MAEVGRPTVMTKDTLRILDDAFANGASDLQACFIAKISSESLYAYQREHPEYTERKQALKDMIKYQAKTNIRQSLMADDEKLRIETSKWYLDRRDKEFKPKSDITSDDKPLPIINLNQDVQGNDSNTEDSSTTQEN